MIIYSGQKNPKRRYYRSRWAVLLSVIFSIIIGIFLISLLIRNQQDARARNTETRVKRVMSLIQTALEEYADENNGHYPGSLSAVNQGGETLKDYLLFIHSEILYENCPIIFNPSGLNGILRPAPDKIPEGEIWVYTDASDSFAADGSIYSIFGGGKGGRILESGMVSRNEGLVKRYRGTHQGVPLIFDLCFTIISRW